MSKPTKVIEKLRAKVALEVNTGTSLIEIDKVPNYDGSKQNYPIYSAGNYGAYTVALLVDNHDHQVNINCVNSQGYDGKCVLRIPKSNIDELCNLLMSLR